jgi:very-short-patch-repair endonuclease
VHPDLAVARLAEAQRGRVSRAQLRAAGLSDRAIAHRVRTGRLHRLHRGVYAVGHALDVPLGREVAALLACGADAVLGHATAAALWGLRERSAAEPIHVISPTAGRRRDGIVVHRGRLDRDDVRVKDGLRVTTAGRTLLALAASADPVELERMAGEAARRNLTTEAGLRELLCRHEGERGTAALRRVLAPGPAFTRSEAERRFLGLVRAARLPAPRVNARVAGLEVDFVWHDRRLAVEVDGYAFHATRAAVEHDRRREAVLDGAGYEVLRVTWRQIADEPEALLVRLARRL